MHPLFNQDGPIGIQGVLVKKSSNEVKSFVDEYKQGEITNNNTLKQTDSNTPQT